jgi:hypothetical protein
LLIPRPAADLIVVVLGSRISVFIRSLVNLKHQLKMRFHLSNAALVALLISAVVLIVTPGVRSLPVVATDLQRRVSSSVINNLQWSNNAVTGAGTGLVNVKQTGMMGPVPVPPPIRAPAPASANPTDTASTQATTTDAASTQAPADSTPTAPSDPATTTAP